jgi:DNA polymerase
MNFQNLERTDKKNPRKGVLRRALRAPQGMSVVVADSAQIEARVTAWLAGQTDLVAAFAENRDIYSEFASRCYGRHIDRKANPDDFIPGFVGKTAILGLGFGMGWLKFAGTLMKGALGGPPVIFNEKVAEELGVDYRAFMEDDVKMDRVRELPSRLEDWAKAVHCAVAESFVKTYRSTNRMVVAYWKKMEGVIECMAAGNSSPTLDTVRHGIRLPSGMVMQYPGLQRSESGDGWSYLGEHKCRKKIYGGSLTENVVQALARQIIADQMQAFRESSGHYPVTMTHDELVYVVDENQDEDVLAALLTCMKTAPAWAPGLPLNAEGGTGPTYGDAK